MSLLWHAPVGYQHDCHSPVFELVDMNVTSLRHETFTVKTRLQPDISDVQVKLTSGVVWRVLWRVLWRIITCSLSPLNMSAEILSANKVAPTTSNFVFIVRGRNLNLAHAQSSPTHEQQILCDGRLEVVSKRGRDCNYQRMSMTLDSNFCTWRSNRLVHGRIDLVKVVNS